MAKNVSITFTINDDAEISMDIQGMEGTACKPFHEDVTKDLAPFVGEIDVTDKPEMKSTGKVRVAPVAATGVKSV
jgi:hypothetical protein